MKTVVTGGAGFIGSHLVRRLMQDGREVVVVDDFSKGNLDNLRKLSVPVQEGPVPVDLADYRQAVAALRGADAVFHLAARVGSVEFLHGSETAELLALQTNLVVDANVFKACLENGVQSVVYASSVAVYPIDRQQSYDAVFKEEDLSYVRPEGGYGWAKLVGELQLGWFKGPNIGVARIFNIYGELANLGQDAHVVPDLLRKALLYPKEEFRVWGDGAQTRDFLYVEDAVDALIKLEEKASNPPLVVNIGSGKAVSMRSLAERIIQVSGKAIEPVYDPTRPVGPLSRTADISRARELLGWAPRVELEEGLKRTFKWVREKQKV